MSGSDPLRRALPLLRPRLPRLVLAVTLGVLSLGSALALAAVSAWLIGRAWQMPPILDLSVAVVAVLLIGVVSLGVAAVLAVCLLVAGVLAPWLSARGAAAAESAARAEHDGRDVAAMLALQHAAELRVAGRLPAVIAETRRRQRDWGAALDRAAAPAAIGAAVPTLAIGAAVLAAAVAGIGLADQLATPTLVILMLVPLSAFEATTALPAAATALTRSRIAARRLIELTGDPRVPLPEPTPGPEPAGWDLTADQLRAGFPGGATGFTGNLALPAGTRHAVTGPSGSGKTALLLTLAGLIPPRAGQVRLGGVPLSELSEPQLRARIGYFAEDAHIFETTVRDNLLAVRGDCTDDELLAALDRVGLGDWLAGLPDGLGTVLTGGAAALSAGQRRRLLLARVLCSPAPVLLLDEPTEHLDIGDAAALLRAIMTPGELFDEGRTVIVATHHLDATAGIVAL
ncbi:thiol reductant ABC exporter subunit CydC [Mycolicibacterium fallax]|uniref:thiol reductant ABC exporter subunit CydC n=1 Tax=Mycolicibacterium fallax TaxID=1793 RepID=UPI0021F3A5EA|nr:thiol reductant ABC exporter subunit CydC [Mycolicibacterium fallax]